MFFKTTSAFGSSCSTFRKSAVISLLQTEWILGSPTSTRSVNYFLVFLKTTPIKYASENVQQVYFITTTWFTVTSHRNASKRHGMAISIKDMTYRNGRTSLTQVTGALHHFCFTDTVTSFSTMNMSSFFYQITPFGVPCSSIWRLSHM